MVKGSKISVHDQTASAVHGNALFSCVLQLDLCVWESVWVPLLPCLHLCTHVHIICSFLKSPHCVYVCARMHYCTCACVCMRVCVSPWGVSVSLVDVGEFDLALFGGSSQGSQPAQLPQRNRGHLFGLHTSRSVLKRLSKQNPRMNF